METKKGKIITFGGTKGGIYKTTLAISLANLQQRKTNPSDILVVDSDSLNVSATKWMGIRSSKEVVPTIPVIQKFGGRDLIDVLKELRDKYTDIFHDIGSGNIMELKASLFLSDIFIAPMPPSQMDVFSISTLENIVDEARIHNPNLKAFMVPTVVSPNNLMSGDELKDLIGLTQDMKHITRTETIIKTRKAYRKAVSQGRTIFELEGKDFDEKAIEEMTNLFNEIKL